MIINAISGLCQQDTSGLVMQYQENCPRYSGEEDEWGDPALYVTTFDVSTFKTAYILFTGGYSNNEYSPHILYKIDVEGGSYEITTQDHIAGSYALIYDVNYNSESKIFSITQDWSEEGVDWFFFGA